MRDFSELNINSGGKRVDTPPPSAQGIQELQEHFDIVLPDAYLRLLAFSNGGHPEVDSFSYANGLGESHVDIFFHLTSDQEDDYGLWWNTQLLREELQRDKTVAIGMNGGGDTIFLDLSGGRESVHIL